MPSSVYIERAKEHQREYQAYLDAQSSLTRARIHAERTGTPNPPVFDNETLTALVVELSDRITELESPIRRA